MVLILLFLLFSLIFLANAVEARDDDRLRRAFNWVLLLFNLPLFLLALGFLFDPGGSLQSGDLGISFTSPRAAGVVLLLTAVWGLAVTLPEFRRFLARYIPLRPTSAVHTLALILVGYLVGNTFASLTQGGLEGLLETTSAASILDVVASEGLYAGVAIAGVGLFIRRDWLKAAERLGLERPAWLQFRSSLRWIGLLLVLQWFTGILFMLTSPGEAEVVDNLNSVLLGNFDTVGEWFILALAAGIGEELLFRGALQPVFGLWATSLIFAMAHIQYGFTAATVLIFAIGLALGFVRRRHGTTTAIIVHFGYNFISGLLVLLAPYLESLAR
jgi:membrane protease YdiL (CAAX protease family)